MISPGTPVSSTNKTDRHDQTIVESGVKHHETKGMKYYLYIYQNLKTKEGIHQTEEGFIMANPKKIDEARRVSGLFIVALGLIYHG